MEAILEKEIGYLKYTAAAALIRRIKDAGSSDYSVTVPLANDLMDIITEGMNLARADNGSGELTPKRTGCEFQYLKLICDFLEDGYNVIFYS